MNEKFDSAARFKEFVEPQFFKRVSETHPFNISIGINSMGSKTLQYKGVFEPQKIKGTTCIDIKQFPDGNENCIQFALTNTSAEALFYKFCDDLVESTSTLEQRENVYVFIINRFLLWKKMFVSKSTIMDEQKIMGLIGELLFLKDFSIPKFGIETAISGWAGAEQKHKDFSYNQDWFEIKAVNSHTEAVTISSIEQLDSNMPGKLVVYTLEAMSSAYKGINLNQLVFQIKNILENVSQADDFFSKLYDYGYAYNENYDQFQYECKGKTAYLVSGDFPRIIKTNLDPRIVKATYQISIDGISQYKVDI
jgi:hypothetical protein